MKQRALSFASLLALALAFSTAGLGQSEDQPVILTIDVENVTIYRGDTLEAAKLGTVPGPTSSPQRPFQMQFNIGDIVAVNGKPAKGLWNIWSIPMVFSTNPAPGQGIADLNGSQAWVCQFHLLQPDGTYVGSLADVGSNSVPYHSLISGTGAFFGVIGEHHLLENIRPARGASMSEDPANRRLHGGGAWRAEFVLYPKFRPAVQMTPAGPAIFHGDDFSAVTAERPARRGERLVVRATGLGPVKPVLGLPGAKPFTRDPLQEVNSPVTVVLNGRELPAINKIGWPGETSVYRVDFEVPGDVPPGAATIQLVAAWIPGSAVTIPIR